MFFSTCAYFFRDHKTTQQTSFLVSSLVFIMSRVQGTVKWFSNKKGYGFVTPTSEDSPVKEDIFVHQSAVHSEGFRSLVRTVQLSYSAMFLASNSSMPDSLFFYLHPPRARVGQWSLRLERTMMASSRHSM